MSETRDAQIHFFVPSDTTVVFDFLYRYICSFFLNISIIIIIVVVVAIPMMMIIIIMCKVTYLIYM